MLTAAEIIAGCERRRAFSIEGGQRHAECAGCDIGATGNSLQDALDRLEVVITTEIRLAVEAAADQHTSTE